MHSGEFAEFHGREREVDFDFERSIFLRFRRGKTEVLSEDGGQLRVLLAEPLQFGVILVIPSAALVANGKLLELLLIGSHVDSATANLLEVPHDLLGIQKHGIHRADVEGAEILIIDGSFNHDGGEKVRRRRINLVAFLKQIESELVAGKTPLLIRNVSRDRPKNQRGYHREKRGVDVTHVHELIQRPDFPCRIARCAVGEDQNGCDRH